MSMFKLLRSIAAPREVVFDVLTDHEAQADVSPVRSSVLEREGEEHPNGVGAIRALHVIGSPIREQVTAFERPSLFAYTLVSGLPARSFSATVTLGVEGSGTFLTYRVESVPKLPIPAAAWSAIVRPGIKLLLDGVVKEAERRTRAESRARRAGNGDTQPAAPSAPAQ
jgi:hypothetical protein